jgi:hypothetical protein
MLVGVVLTKAAELSSKGWSVSDSTRSTSPIIDLCLPASLRNS